MADIICVGVVAIWLGAALVLTGILTSCEALAGFASSAVIALLAVGVVIMGLSLSGFTHRVGALLQQLAGCSVNRLLILSVLAGAFLAFLVNNLAAAAVLMPALTDVARRSSRKLPKPLMPLDLAGNLGGMATPWARALPWSTIPSRTWAGLDFTCWISIR